MPSFVMPGSDSKRLAFLTAAAERGAADLLNGLDYLPQTTIDDLQDLSAQFNALSSQIQVLLTTRMAAVDQAQADLKRLQNALGDLWAHIRRRVRRQGEPVSVLGFYQISEGPNPKPTSRREWANLAEAVIAGDAQALAAGYEIAVSPSILEVQTALTGLKNAITAVDDADRAYDLGQQAVADLRPSVSAIVVRVMAELRASLHTLDLPSFRRIARTYGAQYKYAPGEPPEDDLPAEIPADPSEPPPDPPDPGV